MSGDVRYKCTVIVEQYEALIREKYKELIDGKFEDATASILKRAKTARRRREQ